MFRDTILNFIPKTGDGVAWITSKITEYFAKLFNITPSDIQVRLISLFIILIPIYILFSILSKGKKLIKVGLIVILSILALSVLASILG